MGLEGRVEFTGWLTEERKAELMAGCCGALYLAYLEDSYGYVTLEAFHSGKPVITLNDCGGTLEVIEDGVNGLVAAPEPKALAEAMNRLWADRPTVRRLGARAARLLGNTASIGTMWSRALRHEDRRRLQSGAVRVWRASTLSKC